MLSLGIPNHFCQCSWNACSSNILGNAPGVQDMLLAALGFSGNSEGAPCSLGIQREHPDPGGDLGMRRNVLLFF